ncbi:unnamed protein product [Prorocentrum cordatum]|uniref:Uncharacterized protein n=1 Tax=Prorocentrum cordatum TaxID=2364126 RepID=A0ABN9VBN6_9DINO|nr:unnamed protein product [Polarella glacialis]
MPAAGEMRAAGCAQCSGQPRMALGAAAAAAPRLAPRPWGRRAGASSMAALAPAAGSAAARAWPRLDGRAAVVSLAALAARRASRRARAALGPHHAAQACRERRLAQLRRCAGGGTTTLADAPAEGVRYTGHGLPWRVLDARTASPPHWRVRVLIRLVTSAA